MIPADVAMAPAPNQRNGCFHFAELFMILKPHGDEFRSVIKPTITHGLVQNQAPFVAGYGAVGGDDGDLESTHRSD